MKQGYLIFIFLFVFIANNQASDNVGYIVTKNGIRLTGKIGVIIQTNQISTVIFTNDFGNTYILQPELIAGFVFKQDSLVEAYESKINRDERRWVFMHVLCKGNGFNLYSTIIEKPVNPDNNNISFGTPTMRTQDFYLDQGGKIPFKVKRFGFRKQMRGLLWLRSPALAKKIGSPGYRYKDIINIVEEYNNIVGVKSKKLL